MYMLNKVKHLFWDISVGDTGVLSEKRTYIIQVRATHGHIKGSRGRPCSNGKYKGCSRCDSGLLSPVIKPGKLCQRNSVLWKPWSVNIHIIYVQNISFFSYDSSYMRNFFFQQTISFRFISGCYTQVFQ